MEIEVQGALKVKEKMPEAVMIFVVPPSINELKNRLTLRGREDNDEILKRISIAKGELEKASRYNYIVVNDVLEESIKSVRKIIDERKKDMEFVNNLIGQMQ